MEPGPLAVKICSPSHWTTREFFGFHFNSITLAANSLAAAELRRLGVARVQASVELDRAGLEALRDHSVLPLEVYRYGRPALLTTRASLPMAGELRDNRGNTFSVRPDERQKLTRLYARAVFSIPHVAGTSDFYDLTQARWDEKETSEFNFGSGWL